METQYIIKYHKSLFLLSSHKLKQNDIIVMNENHKTMPVSKQITINQQFNSNSRLHTACNKGHHNKNKNYMKIHICTNMINIYLE